MRNKLANRSEGKSLFIFLVIALLISCGRDSSPEGRMSKQMENLQKGMIDSLMRQNRAILDSLGKIREELVEIKQQRDNFSRVK